LAISKDLKVSVGTVYHTLKKRQFNIDVLTAAMKKVVERKKRLMEYQAEAQAFITYLPGARQE
jgi:hypothetical protein